MHAHARRWKGTLPNATSSHRFAGNENRHLDELWYDVRRVAVHCDEPGPPCFEAVIQVMQAIEQEAESIRTNPASPHASEYFAVLIHNGNISQQICFLVLRHSLAVARKPWIKHKDGVQVLAVLECF